MLCAGVLLVGLPLITLTLNRPTLRPANAAQVRLAPAGMAVRRPRDLVWLAADGCGLMLVLSALTTLERIPGWLDRGGTSWVWMTGVMFLVGVAWLLIVTGLQVWRRRPAPGAAQLSTAGLCVAYLLLPLLHHVLGTDGYFYISDSDNFFTSNVPLQVATWLVVAGVAAGLTRLRQVLETRRL